MLAPIQQKRPEILVTTLRDAPGADHGAHPRTPDDPTRPRQAWDVTGQPISVIVESGDETHVVRIAGELDAASRKSVTQACTMGRAGTVIVDVSLLTFLDCGGHRGFEAARAALAEHGRTLELVGAAGEPHRLLDLIDQIDREEPS